MTIYRERLWPAPWLYFATALVIPASFLVLFPISVLAAVITAIVLYAGTVTFLLATSPVVEVTSTEFRAGKATLPLTVAGTATAFAKEEAVLERGQRLDSRAWLLIRGWIAPVVKVELLDINDPAPYWLVSSRAPETVVAALAEARQPSR
jgi:hypothetical protein